MRLRQLHCVPVCDFEPLQSILMEEQRTQMLHISWTQADRQKKETVCYLWVPPPQWKSHFYCEKKEERQNLHGSEALCSLQPVGKASTGICTSLYPELNSRRRYKSTSSHTPIILPLESLPLGAAGCLCGFSSPQSPLSVFMQTWIALGATRVRWKTPVVIYPATLILSPWKTCLFAISWTINPPH